jgi:hypothetical protein
MRLWTVHPRYLDARGLVALWREGLLAQHVLRGRTVGYRHHPQLERFRAHRTPVRCIASYLRAVHAESLERGYAFDRGKLAATSSGLRITETRGQLLYEWEHLKRKLRRRAPKLYRQVRHVEIPEAHPMFRIVAGGVRDWERTRA